MSAPGGFDGSSAGPGPVAAAQRTAVAEIMTRDVISVSPQLPVPELVTLLLEKGISGVPVIDEDGRPVGVVSKTDIVWDQHTRGDSDGGGAEQAPAGRTRERWTAELGYGFHVEEVPRTVGEIMTTDVVTLPESAPVALAAALMAYEGVHRIPIVGLDGRLAGQVSSLDVLAWLGRQEGYALPRVARRKE